jgi:hypothetical protein
MTRRVVYKYRSWNNDCHRRILSDNEIYLPSPKDFNDPFDCAIIPNYDLLDTVDKKDKFIDQFIAAIKATNSIFEADTYTKVLKGRFESNPSKTIEELKALYRKHQNLAYGIFSLSCNWNSVLMWSHYSDNHKGFCIGFDLEELKKLNEFQMGGDIEYSNEFPQIDPLNHEIEVIFKEINTKASPWSYEEEYRLFSIIGRGAKERKFRIPDSCLREVTLGLRFPEEDIKKVKELIGQRAIKIFQARQVERQFTLDRKLI